MNELTAGKHSTEQHGTGKHLGTTLAFMMALHCFNAIPLVLYIRARSNSFSKIRYVDWHSAV